MWLNPRSIAIRVMFSSGSAAPNASRALANRARRKYPIGDTPLYRLK
jgi:hypothetical protein